MRKLDKTLLIATLFFWAMLIAGIVNAGSVINSLASSLQSDGWFSFLFAAFGCLMVCVMSVVTPILLFKK